MTQLIKLDDCSVKFEIWDTAGQERFKSLAPLYYRDAAATVVVYDITSVESFNNAKAWVSELASFDTLITLVGNKADLEEDRAVDRAMVQELADQWGILHVETSAKSGHNVQELFHEIAMRLPKLVSNDDSRGRTSLKAKGAEDP